VQKNVNIVDLVKIFRTSIHHLLAKLGGDTAENEPSEILKFGYRPTTARVESTLSNEFPSCGCIARLAATASEITPASMRAPFAAALPRKEGDARCQFQKVWHRATPGRSPLRSEVNNFE